MNDMKELTKDLVKVICEFYSSLFTELSLAMDELLKELENEEELKK